MKAAFPVSEDRGQTIKTERYLKKLKSRKIIEQIIEFHLDPIKLAQSRFDRNL